LKVEAALRMCATQHKPALLACAGAWDVNAQAAAGAVLRIVGEPVQVRLSHRYQVKEEEKMMMLSDNVCTRKLR
jgi:thiamine pyrophosphate-dependent acetolactate synthase large subunit-like protein